MLDLVVISALRRDPDLSRDRGFWSSGDKGVVSGDVPAVVWTCGKPFEQEACEYYTSVGYGTISLE